MDNYHANDKVEPNDVEAMNAMTATGCIVAGLICGLTIAAAFAVPMYDKAVQRLHLEACTAGPVNP